MKHVLALVLAVGALLLASSSFSATTRYVNVANPSPAAPYLTWETAATVIQNAIDAAGDGDEIVVTNGVYATGGTIVHPGLTNRISVTKPLTVRSVNGPDVTTIQGYQVPGTVFGDSAVRCAYLANGATLTGFTLTGGATRSGTTGNPVSGGGVWCESSSAVVSNCVLTGNSAYFYGGGAYGGTLDNCTLTGNRGNIYGGGAYSGTLNGCTITDNWGPSGGGAYLATLNDCMLTGNGGGVGGGAYGGTLNNCTLTANSSQQNGGGAWNSTLNNCALASNVASENGGGAAGGTLNNCTITGNWAGFDGGGTYHANLNNCIVYYNTAARSSPNYHECTLNYCCTSPLPSSGSGNLADKPQLASNSHLSAGSPCRGTGSAAYAVGTDIDGEPWASPPSIGCDEYRSGAVTGPLSVAVVASYTNVVVGFTVVLRAAISGRVSASQWNFGGGDVVSNQPHVSRAWQAAGDYTVELKAWNESHPEGVVSSVTIRVVDTPVHYVSLSSPSPTAPFSSWATAATNIQDAVDAATIPGALVLVTNGTYQAGARAVYGMSNRVAVTKPIIVKSVNGPQVTTIRGYQVPGTTNGVAAVRCVYLTNGAMLAGFTLTNGATQVGMLGRPVEVITGGGVWCESAAVVVSNCVLVGNSAKESGGGAYRGSLRECMVVGNSARSGGGVDSGILRNCLLAGNSTSTGPGGGAVWGALDNCTVAANSSAYGGGGIAYAFLNNCIVYGNSAPGTPNYSQGIFNQSCTTPLPPNGVGNLTNAPLFIDLASGDYRLQPNSPCINAGNNAYVTSATDLDGNPRISGGTVDIGAYEFQNPASQLSYAWLQQYGLATDGTADTADPDNDQRTNLQEWRCLTDPTNAASVLRLVTTATGSPGVNVTWASTTNRLYFLERSLNLGLSPAFQMIATNVPGFANTTTYLDTNATGPGPFFYRVAVQQ